MTVYFIGAKTPAGDMVKIGFTNGDAADRLRCLQTGSPVNLDLLHTSPGSAQDERALHGFFANHRQHGEWFTLTDEVWEVIDQLTLGCSIAECTTEYSAADAAA